jgi:pimeloyl-ACP methyl ester carboxylesterase
MEPTLISEEVKVYAAGAVCRGILSIPEECSSIVVFCHEGGNSRHKYSNKYALVELYINNIGSLLIDLLSEDEGGSLDYMNEEELMTKRLADVTSWLIHEKGYNVPLGYYAKSSGAASALKAAIKFGSNVKAVVSLGGRPDLAMGDLKDVKAATLLIVGEKDYIGFIKLNQIAYSKLQCEKKLIEIPESSHLLEGPGEIEDITNEVVTWFNRYLIK